MKDRSKLKSELKAVLSDHSGHEACIEDMMQNEAVRSMDNTIQHRHVSCLKHCLFVSYHSYRICKRFGIDYRSAARGGLLHDFFLYDWHVRGSHKGLHGFRHPYTALKNAEAHFCLNDIEKDIIKKHMWPLTPALPKYKESFIVSFADKYCSLLEILRYRLKIQLRRYDELHAILRLYPQR